MKGARTNLHLLGDVSKAHAFITEAKGGIKVNAGLGPAKTDALGPSMVKPSPGSLDDTETFLFGHPGEHGNQERADGAAHVEPRLPAGDDLDPHVVEREHGGQVADHRSSKPVQGPHNDNTELAGVGVRHELVELRAALDRRCLLFVDGRNVESPNPGELFEVGPLVSQVLLSGAHAEVQGCASGLVGKGVRHRGGVPEWGGSGT